MMMMMSFGSIGLVLDRIYLVGYLSAEYFLESFFLCIFANLLNMQCGDFVCL